MTDQLGESYRQARRELKFQLITWTVFAAWVVGFGAVAAYNAESETVEMTLGMPRWVVWGIAVPWVVAFLITVYFAGWFMQDTELVDDSEPADPASETSAPGNG